MTIRSTFAKTALTAAAVSMISFAAAPTSAAVTLPDPTGVIPTVTILGARLNDNCTPPAVLNARLDTAADYLRSHPLTRVITTGGRTNTHCPFTEAQVMSAGLVTRGVITPSDNENTAVSTVGNARGVAAMGVTNTVLVTSASHMPRAQANFADQGIRTNPLTSVG